MWPEVPVATKVRAAPYLMLAVIGLAFLNGAGSLDQPAEASRSKRTPGASRFAQADIPRAMLSQYQRTCRGAIWRTRSGRRYPCWVVLAGIGKVESDHGRSRAPGVRSGVNRFGCCAGPMQFNVRNGPPSTWDAYGKGNPYRARDAVPAAHRLLVANGARRDIDKAIWHYNHSSIYVAKVKALARRYARR